MNKEYFFNNNEREKIKSFLSENKEFVGSFREKDNEDLFDLYIFKPTTVLLYKNKIKIPGKLLISRLYVKSQLEKGAEIVLKE